MNKRYFNGCNIHCKDILLYLWSRHKEVIDSETLSIAVVMKRT